jgi:hypothetical protein
MVGLLANHDARTKLGSAKPTAFGYPYPLAFGLRVVEEEASQGKGGRGDGEQSPA